MTQRRTNIIKAFFEAYKKIRKPKPDKWEADKEDLQVMQNQINEMQRQLDSVNGRENEPTDFGEFTEIGFANELALAESQYSKKALRAKGTLENKIALEIVESLSGEDLDESVKNKLVESVQALWGTSFGAFGPFSTADFDLTDLQVIGAQRQCFMRYKLDPVAISIIDNLISYVVGKGIKVDTASPEINEQLKKSYWDHNQLDTYNQDRILSTFLAGEYFNRYVEFGEGKEDYRVNLFFIPTSEVTEIEIRENKFPISFVRSFIPNEDQRLKTKVFAYPTIDNDRLVEKMGLEPSGFNFDTNSESEEEVKNEELGVKARLKPNEPVFHWKLGIGRRGKPHLMPILPNLQFYRDFIRDTARLWHEQSRIILVEYRDNDRRGPAGNLFPSPAGGYMIVGIRDQLEYEFMSPDVDGGSAEIIGRILRQPISAGGKTPETVAFYDANSTVYASITETRTPYVKTGEDFQTTIGDWLEKEVRFILGRMIDKSILPPTVKIDAISADSINEVIRLWDEAIVAVKNGGDIDFEDFKEQVDDLLSKTLTKTVETSKIPIDTIFPEIMTMDLQKVSNALKIHQEMGWASRTTISAKLGYNPAQEMANILKDEQMRRLEIEKERDKITRGQDIGRTQDRDKEGND